MSQRRKILMLAAVCHPDQGSEPGLGWNWPANIANYHDVTVITSEREGNREAISRRLKHEPALAKALRFEFLPWFDSPSGRIARLAWQFYQPLYYASYHRWMREAFEVAKQLMAAQHFDLCHQLNMIGFREPGYLWKLPVPFVWGPVGGTQNVPWGMLTSLGPLEGLRHFSRNLFNEWQKRRSQRYRQALARASSVISVASDTSEEIHSLHGVKCRTIAAAFGTPAHARRRIRRPEREVRFIYTGQHISRKGVPFALKAFATLGSDVKWSFDILGAGIMTDTWRRLAERLGIATRVNFRGFVTREQLFDLLDAADVFVFPSLLEGWPASIVEAMSLGLPVITTDHHGMRDMVNEECGIRVDPSRPSRLIRGLAKAFSEVTSNPSLVSMRSTGAIQRAEELSAGRQLPALLEEYERAISSVV